MKNKDYQIGEKMLLTGDTHREPKGSKNKYQERYTMQILTNRKLVQLC